MITKIAERSLPELLKDREEIMERCPHWRDLDTYDAVKLKVLHALEELVQEDPGARMLLPTLMSGFSAQFFEDEDHYYYTVSFKGKIIGSVQSTKILNNNVLTSKPWKGGIPC